MRKEPRALKTSTTKKSKSVSKAQLASAFRVTMELLNAQRAHAFLPSVHTLHRLNLADIEFNNTPLCVEALDG